MLYAIRSFPAFKPHSRMRRMLVSVATILCLFIFLSSITIVGPFSALRSMPTGNSVSVQQDYMYAVVFDAGSTGTRIHVFTFVNNKDGHFSLVDEYYKETKPGLSYYAENPSKAAKTVQDLLEEAKGNIPPEAWRHTPVALKATAGLRLLSDKAAERILSEVRRMLKKYPFHIHDSSVSIMDGEDEGVYGWFTVNFLLGRLSNLNNSVAVFDLGGGSTQMTFVPRKAKTILHSPAGYITQKRFMGRDVKLYSHSYLGLGLMSARLSILQSSSQKSKTNDTRHVLESSCIHPDVRENWRHDGKDFVVTGLRSERFRFSLCYERAIAFLKGKVHRPEELQLQPIYALSYYFDRALESGLIDTTTRGAVTVADYLIAAEKYCAVRSEDMPFLCLDLTYIAALLHFGLGLDQTTEIQLVKKVNFVETSWALGAAYSMLQ